MGHLLKQFILYPSAYTHIYICTKTHRCLGKTVHKSLAFENLMREFGRQMLSMFGGKKIKSDYSFMAKAQM